MDLLTWLFDTPGLVFADLGTGLACLALFCALFFLPRRAGGLPRGAIWPLLAGLVLVYGAALIWTPGWGLAGLVKWPAAASWAALVGAVTALTRDGEPGPRPAEGELWRTTLASIGDGVIVTDAAGRVTFLNRVAEGLTGWGAGDAAGRPLEEVFRIVNETTRQPVENPALRALREGTVVGLANHTVLIARDGGERPIDDSAAPIRDGAGATSGAVLVFRDVSARRRAELAQAERARLAALRADVATALASDGPAEGALRRLCEALVRHLGVAFARVWVLDEAEEVLLLRASAGLYTHLDGPHARVPVGQYKIGRIAAGRQPHLTNSVPDDPKVSDREWARREGMVAFAGYPLALEGRVLGVVAMFSRSALTDGVLGELAPLAEWAAQYLDRKRAEQQLRRGEARKAAVLQAAADAIITVDQLGRAVECNPAAERMFGWRREDVLGRPLEGLVLPPPTEGARVEVPALRSDGALFPAEVAVVRIEGDGGPLFTAYVRDISGPKRAEQRRSARLAITQALAQAESAEQGVAGVLRSACEALVWDMGFFWGLSRGAELRCEASWRPEDAPGGPFEAASRARVFARGQGLPGHVWETGRPVWSADVTGSGNFPRLEAALAEGLRGAFACPVSAGGELLGVIEFFSHEARPPDADLLEMMTTAAGQLGQFLQRRHAEQALRRSEAELADFFENANVGLHWVGHDGTILRANRAELELLGYRADEYVGQNVTKFHADQQAICDILRRLQAGEELHDYPAKLRCKDGTIKDVLIHSSVLREGGRFVHTRCFTRDVTEQRQAEKRLREEAEATEALYRVGTAVAAELDLGRLVQLVTDEATRLTGAAFGAFFYNVLNERGEAYTLYTLSGAPREAFARFPMPRNTAIFDPTFRGLGVVRLDDVTRDPRYGQNAPHRGMPEGHLAVRGYLAAPVKSRSGEVLGGLFLGHPQPGVFTDRHERLAVGVAAQAAVAIDNARLFEAARRERDRAEAGELLSRFLADASATLAALVDYESTLQKIARLAVPRFADWAAVDMAEGGKLRRLAVAHQRPDKVELAHELERRYPPNPDEPHGAYNVLRTGLPEMMAEIPDELLERAARDAEHLRIIRELGLKSYICVPLVARGKTLGVLSFVSAESGRRYDDADLAAARDLAARASVALENAQLYRELREQDRRKDEFLAMLAHELRNPLAPVRNGLQVLRLPGLDADMARQAREMMERQVQHLVRLVDDLMDVSRIMRGKIELRKEPTGLAAVMARAAETAQPAIDAAGHQLSVSMPADTVRVHGDVVRLTQVVSNLLVNACKYSERAGRIWLSGAREGGEAVLRVRDTGIGLAPEDLERIFDLFTQVERSMSRSQGGLGIGLTLVKRLVEMHGGTVTARSEGPGKGSEFEVRLPALEEQPEPRHAAADVGQAPRRRILIVDDNVDAAESLAMMLRLLRHEVRTAYDGPAGLEEASRFLPDVALLDIGLPGMNGYEAAVRLRKMPGLGQALLAAMTGYGSEEDRRRSREAGFDHHLVKPVGPEELTRILAEGR